MVIVEDENIFLLINVIINYFLIHIFDLILWKCTQCVTVVGESQYIATIYIERLSNSSKMQLHVIP